MAVPRSAPVSPCLSCMNRGFSGAAVRRGGSVPSAISWSMARPFSWVAVTLEGVTVAALWLYRNASAASSGCGSGARASGSSAGIAAPPSSSPLMRCSRSAKPSGPSHSTAGRTPV